MTRLERLMIADELGLQVLSYDDYDGVFVKIDGDIIDGTNGHCEIDGIIYYIDEYDKSLIPMI